MKAVPLIAFLLSFCAAAVTGTEIINLQTEFTKNPLGMDVTTPRFSWQMKSDLPADYQRAYHLTVTDESGKTVWDSGKQKEDQSINILYSGLPLQPTTRYHWQVKVWDRNNKSHLATSWFETGLMNSDPDLSAWDGAQWIGGTEEDKVLYSQYLPMFKLSFSVQLNKSLSSTKAGFIYGANDPRLMDANKNVYQIQSAHNESFIMLELDILPVDSGKEALLHIYRSGYHPDDRKDRPLRSFTIPSSLINETNKYGLQTFHLSSSLGYTHIHLNGNERDNFVGEINLNPLGRGGDFIAFPVVGEIGFAVSKGQAASFSNLEIRDYRNPSNLLFAERPGSLFPVLFATEQHSLTVRNSTYALNGQESDVFRVASPDRNSMPMLRTSFSTAASPVKKARLYVTARGIYEMYLNGNRIGQDYFNPGLTQYTKTHLYQTFDVTDYLQPGKNAIGAILGEGWWSGAATFMGELWNFFGDRQSLLAKLVITYADGKEEIVVTNPEQWTYFNKGPRIYGSFFQGEVYDATKEPFIENWSTAAFDDSAWKPATQVSLEGTINHNEDNRSFNMPLVNDYSRMALIGQFGETVRKINELTAVSVEEVRPGVYVYDMGQNMVGVPKITLSGMPSGQEIVMRFAEVKYPDLPKYGDLCGMIMLENIRAAMAQDIYITRGGHEVINPKFTFHGYRFIEITGLKEALPLEAVRGEVLSSIHELASRYETSNSQVNKLWENITWSTYGNFLSIPTDCPQRNERLGWSGDISVFARTATYLAPVNQFLRRHMRAMRDVQREDGRFPDVAPLGGGFGGILWGSAGITVAWESYLQYGDQVLLEEHYEAMKAYIGFLRNYINPETGIFSEGKPTDWGYLADWLSMEDDKNDKSLLWEAYFIYDLEILHKIATILGRDQDAYEFGELGARKKEFFARTYLDALTGKTKFSSFIPSRQGNLVDTQVSYVLPLAFDILSGENKTKAVDHLIATLVRENQTDYPPYSLLTGFIGTAWINKVLSGQGRSDVAYRLLQQTSYPSWLYSVEQGATTIWERVNSYTHLDGFGQNNRMNSFNHYSFGAVGAWMYNYSLGIERDENSPGFKHFLLHPEPDPTGQMTYAKGYYDSMYGRIESSWEWNGTTCQYVWTVPANTTATLSLKAPSKEDIRQNNKPFAAAKGVKYLGEENGTHHFLLSSGRYQVQVENETKIK